MNEAGVSIQIRINNFGMVMKLFDFCSFFKTIKNGKKSVEDIREKVKEK